VKTSPLPIVLALLAAAVALGPSRAKSAQPPLNIVLIVADDLGIYDLGAYGRKEHSTPHLDRLAAQGVRFTDAYAAAPLCSASRAALLTGKHPARLHLTTYLPGRPDSPAQKLLQPRPEGQLPIEEVTVAELLQNAGYATACLGKWHLGAPPFTPEAQGFQTVQPGQPLTTPSATEGSKGERHLADAADAFIQSHRDRPFFLLLSHDSPHIPYQSTPEAEEKFRHTFNPTYAAVIEALDASVGRVLDTLETHQLSSRTLVIFTSDNGGLHVPELGLDPPTHNTPFRAGKGFLHEGGLRVPLIVRWPGLTTPATVASEPVILTDLMPTLLDAAGVAAATATGPLDGQSLVPLLRGQPGQERDLWWHFPHYSNQGGRPASALRHHQWKIIEDLEDNTSELYNLQEDPGETRNLAATEPERTARLSAQLAAARRRHGAQMPGPNPNFSAEAHAPLHLQTDVTRTQPPPTTAAALGQTWAPWRRAVDAAVAGLPSPVRGPDDTVRLLARHARPHGSHLRYEPEPYKDTLGYWVNAEDWAEWSFTVPKPGRYEIEVLQGCGGGNGGSEVAVEIGPHSLRFTVQETGHFQNFIQVVAGEVDLPAGPQKLALRPLNKKRDAVMDVRRVVVRPAAAAAAAR